MTKREFGGSRICSGRRETALIITAIGDRLKALLVALARPKGWVRLWIVGSFIWVVSAALVGYDRVQDINNDSSMHLADYRPTFIEELSPDHRALLAVADSGSVGDRRLAYMSGPEVRADVTESQFKDVRSAYIAIADREWRRERRQKTVEEHLLTGLGPPVLVFALGLAFIWILGGFRSRKVDSPDQN